MTTATKERKLTAKQELFCKYYASDREFFGNGVQSYIEAYDVDVTKSKGAYAAARVNAHKLLTNANILRRINQELEDGVLNDAFVDKQIAFLITQHAEFTPKLGAIKEYNLLKNRITKHVEISGEVELLRNQLGIKLNEPDDSGATDVPDDGEEADGQDPSVVS